MNQRRHRGCRQSGTVTNMTAINGHDINQMTRLYQLDGTVQTHGVVMYTEPDVVVLATNIHSTLVTVLNYRQYITKLIYLSI